nr:hypothetical protein CFP56_52249 [Quercus suber]
MYSERSLRLYVANAAFGIVYSFAFIVAAVKDKSRLQRSASAFLPFTMNATHYPDILLTDCTLAIVAKRRLGRAHVVAIEEQFQRLATTVVISLR